MGLSKKFKRLVTNLRYLIFKIGPFNNFSKKLFDERTSGKQNSIKYKSIYGLRGDRSNNHNCSRHTSSHFPHQTPQGRKHCLIIYSYL